MDTAPIPRRKLEFGLDPAIVPKDWANNDAYTTTFLNALSLLFPEGERFFVESVKAHMKYITEPMKADVTGFIGQEAMHGKAHRELNELIVAHGYKQAPYVEKNLRTFLKSVRKNVLSPKSQLAVTCALEHFTAMMAEQLLTNRKMRDEISSSMIGLWCWHALEETEHKSVAYDVYEAAGGGYVRRVWIMALATTIFFIAQAIVHANLMRTRGVLWKPWTWKGFVKMWIYPAYFTQLVPVYFQYFKPGFHPTDRDTTALCAHWREQLFGEHGALVKQVA